MWHDSVAQRPGNYDENARARMFISRQTYEGMKISIYSLIELVKFLLNSGIDYVLTNRFCQDPVEQYFGKQRGIGRRSDNPTIYAFGYNDNRIRMQRSNLQIQGNTKGQSSTKKQWRDVDNRELPRRRKCKKKK